MDPLRLTRAVLLAAALLPAAGCGAVHVDRLDGEVALFNGRDLTGWKVLRAGWFDAPGHVAVADGRIVLSAGDALTGVAWRGRFPADGYEVELEAMRVAGEDFFCGLTFPVGGSHCTLIVGGWGGQVVGLSNVNEAAADCNETTEMMTFEKGRWYEVRLRVAAGRVRVWIAGERVIDLPTPGRRFDVWPQQEPARPFGVATWHTTGALRNIRLRPAGH